MDRTATTTGLEMAKQAGIIWSTLSRESQVKLASRVCGEGPINVDGCTKIEIKMLCLMLQIGSVLVVSMAPSPPDLSTDDDAPERDPEPKETAEDRYWDRRIDEHFDEQAMGEI